MKRALRLVQSKLERFYELEQAPDVVDFVRTGGGDSRETLVLRQNPDDLEIALVLPAVEHELDPRAAPSDALLQLVEGVSHFVYVAERARTNLPATRLELELQAEVDKFVVLSLAKAAYERAHARALHGTLYEQVRFLDPPGSVAGERYRMANGLAARFVARLVTRGDVVASQRALKRFYRAGQTEKIHLARAA